MRVFNILWDMQPLDSTYKPFLETYTVRLNGDGCVLVNLQVLPVGEYSDKRLTFSCIECVGNLTSLEEFDWYLFPFYLHSIAQFEALVGEVEP